MPMIRVREKHQITLPKEVVIRSLHQKPKRIDIFSFAGAGKQRVYTTDQEADAYISNLRDEWER